MHKLKTKLVNCGLSKNANHFLVILSLKKIIAYYEKGMESLCFVGLIGMFQR